MRLADVDLDQVAPFLTWDEFFTEFGGTQDGFEGDFQWRLGEHVALIGNTGCGKTTVALNILPIRKYSVVIGTKPKSETLDRFQKELRYRRFSAWPDKEPAHKSPRRLLWPPIRSTQEQAKLRGILWHALDRIFYYERKWCVYMDELPELTEELKLNTWIKRYLRQGRELGISLVVAMQRPKFVPLDVYTNSTHLFFWQEKDWSNLERISAISSVDSRVIEYVVTNLRPHEFLYINTRQGEMVRSMSPDPGKGG